MQTQKTHQQAKCYQQQTARAQDGVVADFDVLMVADDRWLDIQDLVLWLERRSELLRDRVAVVLGTGEFAGHALLVADVCNAFFVVLNLSVTERTGHHLRAVYKRKKHELEYDLELFRKHPLQYTNQLTVIKLHHVPAAAELHAALHFSYFLAVIAVEYAGTALPTKYTVCCDWNGEAN